MKFKTGLFVASIIGTVGAQAADWNRSAELGVLVTDGTTETKTINGKLAADVETDKWRHTAKAEALNTAAKKTTTSEKYLGLYKADYKVTAANYLFGQGVYEDDRFSTFAYESTITAGYGRSVFKNEKSSLNVEVGPGVRFFKLKPKAKIGPHIPSDEQTVIHLAAKYENLLSDTAKFTQEVIVDDGEENTISQSITSLSAKIVDSLAMKASVKVKRTSGLPETVEDTDTESALTLVYSF